MHARPIDESAESEITIQPDGRIFAFGITRRPGRRCWRRIPTADERMKRLLERIMRPESSESAQRASHLARTEETESMPEPAARTDSGRRSKPAGAATAPPGEPAPRRHRRAAVAGRRSGRRTSSRC